MTVRPDLHKERRALFLLDWITPDAAASDVTGARNGACITACLLRSSERRLRLHGLGGTVERPCQELHRSFFAVSDAKRRDCRAGSVDHRNEEVLGPTASCAIVAGGRRAVASRVVRSDVTGSAHSALVSVAMVRGAETHAVAGVFVVWSFVWATYEYIRGEASPDWDAQHDAECRPAAAKTVSSTRHESWCVFVVVQNQRTCRPITSVAARHPSARFARAEVSPELPR